MKTVFITGATGVLGSSLLPPFLKEKDTELRLLIRAKNRENLEDRLDKLLSYHGENYRDESLKKRIVAMIGDTTQEKLGLSKQDISSLVKEASHIVHAAASVNMKMSEEEARKISVSSTAEVLSLSHAAKERGVFKKLDYVSTLGVAGMRRGKIPEDSSLQPPGYHNTYESSKAEAEDLVRRYMSTGLPVSIHRPSMIVGDSRNGKIINFQIFYYILEFLSGRFTAGFLPNTNVQLDTISSDTVARAIYLSSCSEEACGKTFHLASGPEDSLSINKIAELVGNSWAEANREIKQQYLPQSLFFAFSKIGQNISFGKTRKAFSNLALLLNHLKADQSFENQNTLSFFSKQGLIFPKPIDFLPTVIDYYLETGKTQVQTPITNSGGPC